MKAHHPPGIFASLSQCRQQQRDQQADQRYNQEHLHQRERKAIAAMKTAAAWEAQARFI